MYFNLFKMNTVRQIHCVGSLRTVAKYMYSKNSSGKICFKIPLPYMQICCFSTTKSMKKEDVIPKPDEDSLLEVYRGSICNYVYRVKAFSLMTSVFSLATQPFILNRALESEEVNIAIIVGSCTFVGFFTFVTPLLLHLITKKYILRLHYCPKTNSYTATTYSFFLNNKHDNFKADEINIPELPGMLTTFEAKGKPYFVDKNCFLDINHYKKIMGFDKPLDFKLSKPESVKKDSF
ncbi:transmembrane protein 70 homolog, mitochondrial [Lycorma delicatula]|uniref:transmembrane protein 70 homolog, mitochondrial n=1 Tax=Lycorma delicatula TaxID=130591 RepID=UPI003F512800